MSDLLFMSGNQYIFYFFLNANLNFCLDEFQTRCFKSRELKGTAILKILIASYREEKGHFQKKYGRVDF